MLAGMGGWGLVSADAMGMANPDRQAKPRVLGTLQRTGEDPGLNQGPSTQCSGTGSSSGLLTASCAPGASGERVAQERAGLGL